MTDDEYRALQESAHLLGELVNHPGWPELHALVVDKSRPETTRLLNGRANDFDDYNYSTGRLVGMQEVIDIPGSILKMRDSETVRRAGREQ